ncbi:MAG: FmdE family protein, partial [Bacteroidales bacterium]|nr:FmdE family protein [Bacteroidales bacterium]
GAKTGLRIMEYLHAGLDEINLVSFAGYTPPLSCFNDGLQVGTGSTIGYGTITVDESKDKTPSVLVKYNGREILFSLKPEVVDEIIKDISSLVKQYGLESEMYWSVLREKSIEKYWLGMSRFDILDIEEK